MGTTNVPDTVYVPAIVWFADSDTSTLVVVCVSTYVVDAKSAHAPHGTSNIKNKITEIASKLETLISDIPESKNENFEIKEYFENIKNKDLDISKKIEKQLLDIENIYFGLTNLKFNLEKFEFEKFKKDFDEKVKKDKEQLIKDETLCKEFSTQKTVREADIKLAKKDYEKAYKSLGFKSEEEYKEKTISEKEIKNLNKEIENYNKDVTANKTMIKELEKNYNNHIPF